MSDANLCRTAAELLRTSAALMIFVDPGPAAPLAGWLDWAGHQADMNGIRAPRHQVELTAAVDTARVILRLLGAL